MLSRLSGFGALNYSVSQDMSGYSDIMVTIENHGPESIDTRFFFDAIDGKLRKVDCYTDRRK